MKKLLTVALVCALVVGCVPKKKEEATSAKPLEQPNSKAEKLAPVKLSPEALVKSADYQTDFMTYYREWQRGAEAASEKYTGQRVCMQALATVDKLGARRRLSIRQPGTNVQIWAYVEEENTAELDKLDLSSGWCVVVGRGGKPKDLSPVLENCRVVFAGVDAGEVSRWRQEARR